MTLDFKSLLDRSPNPYVTLDRDLTIVWANQEYLKATMRSLEDIVGRNLFDAYPSEGESYRQLRASFDRVLETGEPDEIAHIRYDIPDERGSYDTHYWSATHTPLTDDNGEVELILQHTVDITEVETLRRMREAMGVLKRAQAAEERYADASRELLQLRALLEQAPGFVAVLGTSEHRFVMANAAYRQLIGGRDLIGKTVGEALPEMIAQGFIDTLDRVYASGEPYFGAREEVKIQHEPGEGLQTLFLEFIFQPIFSDSGEVQGIFIQGYDATEEVHAEDHQRLLINRPLRRHHKICPANFRFQAGRLGEHLEAGLNRRPGKRHQPKTQPSRRPGARRHREITAKRLGGDLGQAAEAGVRLGEILRAHALLRPINPRGPIDTEQEVLNITRHRHAWPSAACRRLDQKQIVD